MTTNEFLESKRDQYEKELNLLRRIRENHEVYMTQNDWDRLQEVGILLGVLYGNPRTIDGSYLIKNNKN